MHDIPKPQTPNTYITQYADDITIHTYGTHIPTLEYRTNKYLKNLHSYLQQNNLHLSIPKCTTTLFTPDKRQSNYTPKINLNNIHIPLNKNPKILGVTFDTHYTFSKHAQNIHTKAKKRINILKALAGTSWGQSKETITYTYKQFIRPLINYASSIWTPSLSKSHITKLQTIQNAALRIATGCTLATKTDLLHHETKVLPILDHMTLLNTQSLAQLHKSNHPNKHHLTTSQFSHPKRKLKETILTKYKHLLPSDTQQNCDDNTYKQTIKTIHTNIVTDTIQHLFHNPILNTPPPNISTSEEHLSRKHRTFLAQLRSDSCPLLNQYQHKLNPNISNSCPSCFMSPHNTLHIFNCSKHPTQLQPSDLWSNPSEVIQFFTHPERTTLFHHEIG